MSHTRTPLPGLDALPDHVLAEILDGGQSFRWDRDSDGSWHGVVGRTKATIVPHAGTWKLRVDAGTREEVERHLAMDTDWTAVEDALPHRSDEHLRRCMAAFPGLRIVSQPIGEALLGFQCSSMKTIAGIKRMMTALAGRFGDPIAPGIHALPTWSQLAEIREDDLRRCGLGFRARHVSASAKYLAANPGWLDETTTLSYAEAHARLVQLPGVGPKIADCVLLFGCGRLEAFPVDVWILRAMQRHYGLRGWRPAQVEHFGRAHFGPFCGLAQQYLFAWERHHGGESA